MGVDKIVYINPDPERPSRCFFLLPGPFPINPSPHEGNQTPKQPKKWTCKLSIKRPSGLFMALPCWVHLVWEQGALQGVLGRTQQVPTEPAKGQPPRQPRRRSAQHRGRSSPCLRPRRAVIDAGVSQTKATKLHRARIVPGAPLGRPLVSRSSRK